MLSPMSMPKILFYITRDIERALGLSVETEGYFIISNSTPFSKQIAEGQSNILLIEESTLFDTHELLNHESTQKFIKKNSTEKKPNILVFKNTTTIEKICAEKNWNLLNPSAKLSQTIEEKISQVEWLGDLTKYLPPHKIELAKNVLYTNAWFEDRPFMLQFNRAHTGLGTLFISSPEELSEIQTKFPDRPVRITKFIGGPMLTSNNVVTPNTILMGNVSYQITGLALFTENPFATIGNDWGLPHKILQEKHFTKLTEITKAIGEKLRACGWKGLFGIDAIYDPETDDIFLIEINARQPASTTYESQLQKKSLTTFEAHIQALLDIDLKNTELTKITDGAQIIIRKSDLTTQKNQNEIIEKLQSLNLELNMIPYTNTEPGSDWIRIQSHQSIMKAPAEFNSIGQQIQHIMPASRKILSLEALSVITNYTLLPFPDKDVSCPYFNNRRSKVRAGLRVLLGKGSPTEIVEEAQLFALREKVNLNQLSNEDLKKFLVDHNLGIDCSAFAYSILNIEYKIKNTSELSSKLFYPNISLIRKLLIQLRPIENINVRTLAHEKNSRMVELKDVSPGDMIIILNSGKDHTLNHILIVLRVEYGENFPKAIQYVHSFQWSTDGKYNHGIKDGTIEITNIQKPLLEQNWIEAEKIGDENETYLRAKEAEVLELKRLKVL